MELIMKKIFRKRIFKQTLIASSITMALMACQNIDEQAKKDSSEKDEEVVSVSGSRIKRSEIETTSPIVVISREHQLADNQAELLESEVKVQRKERQLIRSHPPQKPVALYARPHSMDYVGSVTDQAPINGEKYQHLEENSIKQVYSEASLNL